MMTLGTLIIPGAGGHATHLDPLEYGCKGEVDIEANPLGQTLPEHLGCDGTDIRAEGFKVGIVAMVAEREGHRRDILHTTFEGNAHRATIVGIDRGIIAMVDTANNHIRPTRTNLGER